VRRDVRQVERDPAPRGGLLGAAACGPERGIDLLDGFTAPLDRTSSAEPTPAARVREKLARGRDRAAALLRLLPGGVLEVDGAARKVDPS